MSNVIRDLTGQVFGRLTAINTISVNRSGQRIWSFQCECGQIYSASMDHVTRKKSPIKSCGCLLKEMVGSKSPHWRGYGEISAHWWHSHVLRERKQTTRVKVPVTITIQYAWDLFIEQNRKCALSGVDIKIDSGTYGTASIDRIDSEKGYIEGNIQWVHKHINFMKRTYSQEYFIEMCSKVAVLHSKQGKRL